MIKILEKSVADKIAAGEVIDRPVSIVKELVENALDSGADQITVEIREGGKSYIRVTDNGCGIEADDVETAFLRHATSKITTEKDLDSIGTLGFRGEALASICAVARVELITKTADAKTGRRVIVENSRTVENKPTGCPEGTTITVRDLFFNVPARHKFLATDASESRRIIDFLSRIALSYPDVRFNVINGSKTVFTTSGRGNVLSNIISIYGNDIGKDLIPVEEAAGGFTLKGFVSSPGTTLSSRSRQIFCVNGRIISSSVMERALDKAYRERLFSGRFPVAFLFLAMPPEKLDVNIHPTKKEVRFDDNAEVEDFVEMAVSQALKGKESIPAITAKPSVPVKMPEPEQFIEKKKPESDVYNVAPRKFKFNDGNETQGEQVNINKLLETLSNERDNAITHESQEEKTETKVPVPNRPFDFDELTVIGAVFNTYILAQDSDNFYMIDQHAAHERIFYERLMNQYSSADKALQQLMIPLNFSVSRDVVATEDAWIDTVKSIGYDIEFFGNNTYIVREIPAFMEMKEAEDFLNDLFNEFASRPDLTNRSIVEKIIMKSCKSAVKAGDLLTTPEIDSLFAQLRQCDNPFSCPHGRPTFIKMTRYEIERMFKRV
mgnify:CR=1 FL=1